MLWLSAIFVICFFGGWNFFFCQPSAYIFIFKILIAAFAIIKVRANYPRYRYDQLMNLGWKTILPFSLGYFLFVVTLLIIL